MKKISITLFLCVLIVLSTGCSKVNNIDPVDPTSETDVLIEIPKGTTLSGAADILKNQNLINSKISYIHYAKKNNLTNIKAGRYKLKQAMSTPEILETMVSGKTYEGEKIIIPEGFTLEKIAARLEKNGIVSSDSFMKESFTPEKYITQYDFLKDFKQENLEGYITPDTYYFDKNSSAEFVIQKFLNQFQKNYDDNIAFEMKNTSMSLPDIIILASVIEKETSNQNSRALVSSVFHNRLKKGMRLQSDATVQYAIKERKDRVYYKDIKIESPYNTYKVDGLPAGAICNPGTDSIIAAINPAESNYLFFLTKNDGSNEDVFAETYEEHLKNKNKYLKY